MMSRTLETRLARLEGARHDGPIYVGLPCRHAAEEVAARIARARGRAGDVAGTREIVIIEGAWMEPH